MVEVIKSAGAYDAALRDNKSVFVDFYADWCGPCKMAGPVVEKVSEANPDVKFLKVNTDDFPEIAQRYGIMSIPTMIGFKDGKAVEQSIGFKPESDIQEIVNRLK